MAEFGKLNFSVAFNPTSAFPLDARYYFNSLVSAQEAASSAVDVGSSEGSYYIGQNLVVVENEEAKLYVIQPDKSLSPVGSGAGNISIKVGTVTTGEPGTDVIITNSGTETNPVFDFTIPRGDNGGDGPKGDKGNVMYATFNVDLTTGELSMNTDDEYNGPNFSLTDNNLEVSISDIEGMTDTVSLGKVSVTPKGEYSSETNYDVLDIVKYNNDIFIVKQKCTGVTPEDGEYYMLICHTPVKGVDYFTEEEKQEMISTIKSELQQQ